MAKLKQVYNRRAVLWECPDCLADNLHPTDVEEFCCLSCGVALVCIGGPESANFYEVAASAAEKQRKKEEK